MAFKTKARGIWANFQTNGETVYVPLTPHIDPAKVAEDIRKQLTYYQGM